MNLKTNQVIVDIITMKKKCKPILYEADCDSTSESVENVNDNNFESVIVTDESDNNCESASVEGECETDEEEKY